MSTGSVFYIKCTTQARSGRSETGDLDLLCAHELHILTDTVQHIFTTDLHLQTHKLQLAQLRPTDYAQAKELTIWITDQQNLNANFVTKTLQRRISFSHRWPRQ